MVKINRNALSGSEALRHIDWLRRYIFPVRRSFFMKIYVFGTFIIWETVQTQ